MSYESKNKKNLITIGLVVADIVALIVLGVLVAVKCMPPVEVPEPKTMAEFEKIMKKMGYIRSSDLKYEDARGSWAMYLDKEGTEAILFYDVRFEEDLQELIEDAAAGEDNELGDSLRSFNWSKEYEKKSFCTEGKNIVCVGDVHVKNTYLGILVSKENADLSMMKIQELISAMNY